MQIFQSPFLVLDFSNYALRAPSVGYLVVDFCRYLHQPHIAVDLPGPDHSILGFLLPENLFTDEKSVRDETCFKAVPQFPPAFHHEEPFPPSCAGFLLEFQKSLYPGIPG